MEIFMCAKLPDGDEDIVLLVITPGNELVGVAIVKKNIHRWMIQRWNQTIKLDY